MSEENIKTILLVEDDYFIIDIYSMQLKKEGYDLELAVDGEAAISKLKEKIPDLVILDLALPKIDGWEVLRIIREDLKLMDLKVVIFSAQSNQDDKIKGEKYGIIKYFTKTEKSPSEMAIEIKGILENPQNVSPVESIEAVQNIEPTQNTETVKSINLSSSIEIPEDNSQPKKKIKITLK